MAEYTKSEINKINRNPGRASYDTEVIHAILDNHFLCHVAYVFRNTAISIPTAYGRKDETIYLHGAAGNRMLRGLLDAEKVSLTVTHIDGLVLARSVFHHSMNYRSVTVFGTAREVSDEKEKEEALYLITENIIPGRWNEARSPNNNELKSTLVIALDIQNASAKIRTGDPKDDEEDYDLDVWAGVIPLKLTPQPPVADKRLGQDIDMNLSIKNFKL